MAQDHNDIYSIVERLRLVEANLSPVATKKGLTKQQKSVPQLPALFKPKHISVLGSKTDPEHPMKGYAVGADESVDNDQPMLEAEMAEDVIEKVKKSFTDFIKQAEEQIKDSDIKEKKKEDTDLKSKDKRDRDLIAKEQETPAKTVTNECGLWEVFGNDDHGFEIRRSGRALPTRFKNLNEAEIALELFAHRMRQQSEAQDYMEEK